MSLLEKATLILPSSPSYKEGIIQPIKPLTTAFNFSRPTTATRINKDGLIETVAANIPRLNYPIVNGVVGSCPSLLLEPTKTNFLLHSEDFTNPVWVKFSAGTGTDPVATANYAISPDGTQNADRVVFDKGIGTGPDDLSIIRQIVTDVGQGISSAYIKSNTNENYIMAIDEIGLVQRITVTPEWQKFTYSETTNDRLQLSLRGSETSNYADVSILGAQLEPGGLTSYIPTAGSAVTRVADDIENTDGVSLSGDFAFVVHLKNFTDKALGNYPLQFLLRESESPNSYFRFLLEANGGWFAQLRDNDASVTRFNASYNVPLTDLGDDIKLGFSKSGSFCSFYVNGALVSSSTITDFNYTFNRTNHTPGNEQTTELSRLTVCNSGLSAAELIKLTS